MKPMRVRVCEGGRIVIPAEFRKALGVAPGDQLILDFDNNEVCMFTPAEALKRVQAAFRPYLPQGRSLVDEFIAERRAEAARE